VKKRTRTRRRTTRGSSAKNTPKKSSNGNVSESSEESKRSLQRQHAPKKSKQPIHDMTEMEQARYVAMDCEMVGVGEDGMRSALARVTIVNWNAEIVYDTFVRPTEKVTDYRTFVSGITAADLDDTDETDARTAPLVSLETCRAEVMALIQDKTLIGHALKNDLAVLKIQHPWQFTRDTAKYEPFMKQRFDDGILWPRKLKELVWEHLQANIQLPGRPHSALEDAVAALQLYQCVRVKWEKVMAYKIRKTAEIVHVQALTVTATAWPALVSTA
jgi:RNA exonuclease 4